MNDTDQNNGHDPHGRISVKQMAAFVRKMRISDGDVLAIKSGCQLATTDNIEKLRDLLYRANMQNSVIVVVDDFDDLTVLDRKAMRKLGWFHITDIRRPPK